MTDLLEILDHASPSEMEIVESCPVCGNLDATFLFWNCDRLYHIQGKFGTYSCSACGLIRISPRPTPATIGKYYPEDYGAYLNPSFSIDHVKDRDKASIKNWIRKSVLSALGYGSKANLGIVNLTSHFLKLLFHKYATYGYADRFPRFVPGGSALEIGCGNGAYLSYLKHHGWNVQGLDLSPYAAQAAKDNFDIDVFVGELEQAPFLDSSFDYIHMSHVVEHFFNPLRSMRRVHELLKAGGRIYVEVPNALGVGAKLSRELWYGWDAPRHLFMFTPVTLVDCLSRAGFIVEKMTTIPVDSFAWETTFARESATGKMESSRPCVAGTAVGQIKRKWLLSRLTHLIRPLSGDFISCWARKSVSVEN